MPVDWFVAGLVVWILVIGAVVALCRSVGDIDGRIGPSLDQGRKAELE